MITKNYITKVLIVFLLLLQWNALGQNSTPFSIGKTFKIHSKILKRLDMAFIQRAFYVFNPFMLFVPNKIGDDEERYLIDIGVRYIWYWVGFLFHDIYDLHL